MEIELKYLLDEGDIEKIWSDEYLSGMEEKDSREILAMHAVYFDTEDMALAGADIALRVRIEGERTVASLKWKGSSEDALHRRQEVNVPLNDDACLLQPDISVFSESEIGKEIAEIVNGRPLVNIVEMKYVRRRFRVDTGENIIEISLDRGEIMTDKASAPVCEIEFELFTGDEEGLKKLGERMSEKYSLKAETRSKYARGLALLKGE